MFDKSSPRNDKAFARWDAWQRTRVIGRARWVWLVGVLGWGGFMFVVFAVRDYLREYGPVWPTADQFPTLLHSNLGNMFIVLVGGYIFGAYTWSVMEKLCGPHVDSERP